MSGDSAQLFRGLDGHLDSAAVIDQMLATWPALGPILDADDDISGGLPCLQISWIAKALVESAANGDVGPLGPILQIAEQVLADFGQEGRDFIGACFAEGIPDGGERILAPYAGPLLMREMAPYMDASAE